MFDIDETLPNFAPTAHMVVNETYKGATADDRVRVATTDGFNTDISYICFASVRAEDAMVHALAACEAEWDNHLPLHMVAGALIAYRDNQGMWCVECGNSVYTGENGSYVCSNPSCCNHDSDNCPVWVKELHNVA